MSHTIIERCKKKIIEKCHRKLSSKKMKFWSKNGMFANNEILVHKTDFLTTKLILVKKWNFGQKMTCWSKDGIFANNEILVQKTEFLAKNEFWQKWNFDQKMKF